MKFIFHLGPHKTGSTSIQYFLQQNSALFRESQIFVPTPLTDHPGHHEIPWSVFGWNLKILGSKNSEISLRDYVDAVLQEAEIASCSSVVFSSEDLSLLDLDQWSTLLSEMHSRASHKGAVQFQFVSVNRGRNEYIASQYKTLVLLGLSQKFDAVKADLESHFENVHHRLGQVSGQFANISEMTEIPYVRDNMVSAFMETVFPAVEAPDEAVSQTHLNSGYHDDMIEILREWNVGTGIQFHKQTLLHWPSFHTSSSVNRLFSRRQKLFGAYDGLTGERDALMGERDALMGERDALMGERDALIKSNSWKITGPLRKLRKITSPRARPIRVEMHKIDPPSEQKHV